MALSKLILFDVEFFILFYSGMSRSYSTHRDNSLANHTGFSISNGRFDERTTESPAMLANEVIHSCAEKLSYLFLWLMCCPQDIMLQKLRLVFAH